MISNLYDAIEWINAIAGSNESNEIHIIQMTEAIQQAINTLDELQINGTID